MPVILVFFFLFFVCQNTEEAQAMFSPALKSDSCAYWQSFVDPKVSPLGVRSQSDKKGKQLRIIEKPLTEDMNIDEQRILKGIQCLLNLEGSKHDSIFKGATGPLTSQTFGPTSVEVAALYYISYLYYRKWDYALAAQLVTDQGFVNDSDSIRKAYTAYKKWFKKVKQIGLEKARAEGLDPLDGTGISWYGLAPK